MYSQPRIRNKVFIFNFVYFLVELSKGCLMPFKLHLNRISRDSLTANRSVVASITAGFIEADNILRNPEMCKSRTTCIDCIWHSLSFRVASFPVLDGFNNALSIYRLNRFEYARRFNELFRIPYLSSIISTTELKCLPKCVLSTYACGREF